MRPNLPTELILDISRYLQSERGISAFAQTSKQLHCILNPYLYRHNVRYGGSSALWWALDLDRLAADLGQLSLSADFDVYNFPLEPDIADFLPVVPNIRARDAIIRFSAESSADLECCHNNGTRLLYRFASFVRAEPLFWLLVKHSADITVHSDCGLTLLRAAAYAGNTRIIRFLLKANPELDIDATSAGGDTALYYAVRRRKCPAVRLLLELRPDMAMTYWFRRFLIFDLAQWCAPPYEQWFALLRIVLDFRKTSIQEAHPALNGASVLHYIIGTRNPQGPKALELFLSIGTDVGARDDAGCTPLHVAASLGDPEATKVLVEHGADANATDAEGFSVLRAAYRSLHPSSRKVARYLLPMPRGIWERDNL
jgi:ankyrin repeat protein